MQELGAMIMRHQGIHEGLFDVKVEFQIGVGGMGPDQKNLLPGVMFGLSKIGLTPSIQPNDSTLDAGKLNPPPKKKPSK